MGERALAGADPQDLAGEAIELMWTSLPLGGAEVMLATGSALASHGSLMEAGVCLAIGAGNELHVAPARELSGEEFSFVRAVANIARHGAGTAARRGADATRGGSRSR